MNESHTDPAYRAISVVVLIQAGVVVGGTLFVTAMLKAFGYNGGAVPDTFFKPVALFVRHSGFMLLLIPAVWATLAIFTARRASSPWFLFAIFLLGIAAILFGLYNYLILGFNPSMR